MLHEMTVRVNRENSETGESEVHEILMREVSYIVIPPAAQRVEEIIALSNSPEEAANQIMSEGLLG